MRVLIAEDSAMTRRMLQAAVEGLGYECVVAANGIEAWELYQTHSPDVIISDWLMPGIEGPELCRRVRGHVASAAGQAPYTYFILLTVLEDKQHALLGMEAGADDYLTKPLDLDDLRVRLIAASRVTTLHRALAQREAERERMLARLNGLLRLARRFAAEGNVEQVLTELLDEAMSALGAIGGGLLRWDEHQEVLVPVRSSLLNEETWVVHTAERGASRRVIEERRPVIMNDYQQDVVEDTPARRAGIRAAVAAPLLDEGRLLGVLVVVTDQPGVQFTAEDAQILELLASLGAAALVGLERARLDGVLLAARTAQHELNNRLTLTTGFAELLSRDGELPERLRTAAMHAWQGAKDAAQILQQLQRVTHLEETDWGPELHRTIDLQGSTTELPRPTREQLRLAAERELAAKQEQAPTTPSEG